MMTKTNTVINNWAVCDKPWNAAVDLQAGYRETTHMTICSNSLAFLNTSRTLSPNAISLLFNKKSTQQLLRSVHTFT